MTLKEAIERTFLFGRRSQRAIAYLVSPTEISLSAVDARIADACIREVLGTLRNPAFQIPEKRQ